MTFYGGDEAMPNRNIEARKKYAREWMRRKRANNPAYVAQQNVWRKANNERLKEKLIEAYSNNSGCVCCGETERFFLQLDHINGGGCEHARRLAAARGKSVGIRYGRMIWRDLEKRGFPPGFQILCANCNVGKYRNGGVCPHRQVRKVSNS
jgi:hypothetical protein